DAVDLGLVSSDMLQYATVCYGDVDAGFMVTASHNPKEYNGLKSCLKNAEPVNLKDLGPKIADFLARTPVPSDIVGKEEVRDVSDLWTEHVASFARGSLKGIKVVADAGNGAAGAFLPKLAKRLGFEMTGLFLEPDGNFPNHHPSPIESKNTLDLVAKVREVGADVGVAFDGDADRAVACDETGTVVPAAAMMCSIAENVLSEKPGASVVYNAVSSDAVPELVTALGGKPVKAKVGHVYIKEMMKADPSIEFGGEHSSHYYFRKNANADSGIIAFVCFLSAMVEKNQKASDVRKAYAKYPAIEETNFRVSDVAAATAKIEAAYPEAEKERFDGLTLRMPTFWINLRPSSNEPLLRLNLEAHDENTLSREFGNVRRILEE
ncbi:MAG: Phosphomannomutase, partial [Patescibacteria group bacterium]|nr:Phosphomannomutase [Patescibacteria group bacterium]